ncbi:MAG: hypothetical protein M3Y82_05260 [Verrucomicrobiota bacterium]|nr:hypothetical protein [Verrucomicrobiota bacterium]
MIAVESIRKESPVPPILSGLQQFDWPLAFAAEELIRQHIATFLAKNNFAAQLAARMANETATDFFEWIDHLVLSPADETALRKVGFSNDEVETPAGEIVLHHPRATLPRIILRAGQKQNPSVIALRPEFIADFMAKLNLTGEIEGEPCSCYRRFLVSEENGARLEAIERHAYRGFVSAKLKSGELEKIIQAKELWRTRQRRAFKNDAEGFAIANKILDKSLELVGRDLSCQFYFEEERAYWESRNRAAQIQKRRQDQLGLGWGNHDHHTFRSSREHFVDVNNFLLRLGFEKRERYYAGAEAGWGAQISEQPVVGIVVFADVDLMPDETQIDFSSTRLSPAPKLGTVGLWIGLHSESFLDAGMHHLEARFDFELLRDQLKERGINTMNPFSNFEFLRQAFTEGERWPVCRERADKLLRAKLITPEQFEKFIKEGALGSHLENLQRRGGFKGFNQKAVSVIIAGTDPRKNHFEPVAA